MRDELTKEKARRKYTSERNNSLCANQPGKPSFRDYSFPDDWEECWRHLKGKILSEQTSLASPCFGVIRFRQLKTFATGSTANLFAGKQYNKFICWLLEKAERGAEERKDTQKVYIRKE